MITSEAVTAAPMPISAQALARWIAERAPAGAVTVADLRSQLAAAGAATDRDLTLVVLQPEGLAMLPTRVPSAGQALERIAATARRQGWHGTPEAFAARLGAAAAPRLVAGQQPVDALQSAVEESALYLLHRRAPGVLGGWSANPGGGRIAVVRFDAGNGNAPVFRHAQFELDETRDARLLSLRHVRADVPCGTCTLCCRVYRVPLAPWEDPADFAGLVEGDGHGGWRLRHGTDGACINLVEGRCTIYERRPAACRAFDCRSASLNPAAPGGQLAEIARRGREMLEAFGEEAYLESLAASVTGNDGFRDEVVSRARAALACLAVRRQAEAHFSRHPGSDSVRIEDERAARVIGSATAAVVARRTPDGVRLDPELETG